MTDPPNHTDRSQRQPPLDSTSTAVNQFFLPGTLSRTGSDQGLTAGWRKLLDRTGVFPNSDAFMGKHDNRTSMKMRRKKAQKKLKARIKRQKETKRTARGGSTKAAKKPRAAAPAKE